jgi:hypothetical protein
MVSRQIRPLQSHKLELAVGIIEFQFSTENEIPKACLITSKFTPPKKSGHCYYSARRVNSHHTTVQREREDNIGIARGRSKKQKRTLLYKCSGARCTFSQSSGAQGRLFFSDVYSGVRHANRPPAVCAWKCLCVSHTLRHRLSTKNKRRFF